MVDTEKAQKSDTPGINYYSRKIQPWSVKNIKKNLDALEIAEIPFIFQWNNM